MPAIRINLRDQMVAIVAAALPAYDGKVEATKLDKVEKGIAASVYLGDGASEPMAMRGHRVRSQPVTVSLFSEAPSDVEALLSDQVNTLEKAVETARAAGEFENISTVYLSGFRIELDPNSKGKRGEAHAEFTFAFTESIS